MTARAAAAVAAALVSAAALGLCARMEARWLPLLWVALVPWLAALDGAARLAHVLLASITLTVAFVLLVFWWFAGAVATYADVPAATGVLVLLALTPILAPQFLAAALVRWRLRRLARPGLVALGTAAAWLGSEWLVPKLFADTLGHGLFPSRLWRQGADVAGVPGLTLAVLAVNEAVLGAARALHRGRVRQAIAPLGVALAVPALLAGYGALRVQAFAPGAAPSEAGVRVLVAQADIGQYARLAARGSTYEAVREILDVHFALSASARPAPDLLVWPETVYPTTFGAPKSPDGAAFDRELAGFVARQGVPLLFGTYEAEGGHEFNAAVLLEPEPGGGVTWDAYRKAALFPLIEYVPAWLDWPRLRRALPWLGAWRPGAGAMVLVVRLPDGRRLRAAPLVCYDATRSRLARAAVRQGAELLVTLSNDSWFDEGAGPRLHLVVSAFRSVETRRPQVRATNTGISAVIDATGELVARAGVHERTALHAVVRPESAARTPVVRWGEWLGPAGVLLAVAMLLGTSGRPRA